MPVQLAERWDTIRGWRMFSRTCVTDPNASAVVLVHGLSMSSLYMLPTAQRLAEHFRVYLPDLPGYGRSQKPRDSLNIVELADILAAWMDALEIGPAVMVGNSLGCNFIAALNDRAPSLITHAVLIGLYPDPTSRTYFRTIKRGFYQLFFEPPDFIAVALMDYIAHGFKRTFQTLDHAFNDPFEERLTRMTMPVLVVRGQHDRITSAVWSEASAQVLPQGRLVTIPGGGHVVNYDAADKLAAEIQSFIKLGNSPKVS